MIIASGRLKWACAHIWKKLGLSLLLSQFNPGENHMGKSKNSHTAPAAKGNRWDNLSPQDLELLTDFCERMPYEAAQFWGMEVRPGVWRVLIQTYEDQQFFNLSPGLNA